MEQHNLLSKSENRPPALANFALGADHGGLELKEMLKAWLRERGLTVTDFGAHQRSGG